MSHANDILSLASEARPVIEEWLRAAEKIAAFREFATEKEIEWSQLKAVIVASIKDEADSGERLKKLADTADNRLSYAAIFLKTNSATENKIKLSVVWSPPISRETSEQTTEPVASAPPRTPSDGAAVSNSPAPDTAAIIEPEIPAERGTARKAPSEGVIGRSPNCGPVRQSLSASDRLEPQGRFTEPALSNPEPVVPPGNGGALPEQPRTLAGDAPILSDDGDVRGTPFDRSLWRESSGLGNGFQDLAESGVCARAWS